jgi:DNA-binding NarL/FixJ family response regulator
VSLGATEAAQSDEFCAAFFPESAPSDFPGTWPGPFSAIFYCDNPAAFASAPDANFGRLKAACDTGQTPIKPSYGISAASMSERANPPNAPIRIVTAHASEAVRGQLRGIIARTPEWEVCGEARTGAEAIDLAVGLRPDIVVAALAVPGVDGLEVTRRIREALPGTEVLVFTTQATEDLTRDILAAGAQGYLLHSEIADKLGPAIDALSRHRPYLTWNATRLVLEAYLRDAEEARSATGPLRVLTAREREILQLLAEGRSNDGISTLLLISVKTVETHRAAIMKKLGLSSLAGLVRYAIRNRVVDGA